MLVNGEGGGEKIRSHIPKWLRRTDVKPKKPVSEGNTEKITQANKELIQHLKASKGTAPELLLGQTTGKLALNFLVDMSSRGMPGAEEISIGKNEYTKAYMIGVTELSGLRTNTDERGEYYTVFGAKVYACEDGQLRAPVKESYENHAFEPFSFPFEPDLHSDVVQGDFASGRIEASTENGKERFYPVPLEEILGSIAANHFSEGLQ